MEPTLITNRDFIIVGQQAWDTEIGSNCKNIALELSTNNRVLYINPPLDRITVFRNKCDEKIIKRKRMMRGEENSLIKIQENLWNLYPDCMLESINWIKSHFLFDLVNKWNNARYARSITKATDFLGFKDFILFNDNDIFKSFYLKEFLHPKTSIYYSRDYMLGTQYWKYHGEMLEPELIKKNDLCLANSQYLTNYCKKYNINSFFIGQGCDLSLFTSLKQQKLPDLQHLQQPLIGYVGALSSPRLDIDLIAFVAKANPDWSIVLIGPEDAGFQISELHLIKNIHFMGLKEASVLPNYIDALDVCINPQLVNEITIGNYPRKIDEYLALGKPVVAIATEAMLMFKEHTYLAQNKEEFVQQIHLALAENTLQKQHQRMSFAFNHTWENSVNAMYKAIVQTENRLMAVKENYR
ncbi:glycosyltransferase [Mucilaginibacter arboris]|uniref:Glycosyltransferase n=1 Tax=Mucilaginibacter arboris TaxID=2682090 RepID=A0A7K1T059_9SPHI|nr:glycosyltransferase [Mucilaginibacter arboris]MVN22952.1 glycosyltransferase [Mucilaginibacter arboris]